MRPRYAIQIVALILQFRAVACFIFQIIRRPSKKRHASRVVTIFHRTPVVWGQAERWYRKQAYGVETLEIHFNEAEFLALLAKNGLELIMTYTLHEGGTGDKHTEGHANRTYVCKKAGL